MLKFSLKMTFSEYFQVIINYQENYKQIQIYIYIYINKNNTFNIMLFTKAKVC